MVPCCHLASFDSWEMLLALFRSGLAQSMDFGEVWTDLTDSLWLQGLGTLISFPLELSFHEFPDRFVQLVGAWEYLGIFRGQDLSVLLAEMGMLLSPGMLLAPL